MIFDRVLPCSCKNRPKIREGIMPKTNNQQHLPFRFLFAALSSVFLIVIPCRALRSAPCRTSSLFRHSGFVIRHYKPSLGGMLLRSISMFLSLKFTLFTLLLITLLPTTITFATGSYSGGNGQPATPSQKTFPPRVVTRGLPYRRHLAGFLELRPQPGGLLKYS